MAPVFVASWVQAGEVPADDSSVLPGVAAGVETDKADFGWHVDIVPFPIWLPDAKGKLGVKGATLKYDLSHGDVINLMKELDRGFTGAIEVRKDRWILGADVISAKLENVSLSDVNFSSEFVDVDMEIDVVMMNLMLGYRFFDGTLGDGSYPRLTLDGMADAYYFYLGQQTTVTKSPLGLLNGKEVVDYTGYFWEPMVGGRARLQFSEKWNLSAKVLLGGKGYWDSEGSTDGTADVLFGYRMSKHWTVFFGARWLDFAVEKDEIDIYSMENSWGPVLAFAATL